MVRSDWRIQTLRSSSGVEGKACASLPQRADIAIHQPHRRRLAARPRDPGRQKTRARSGRTNRYRSRRLSGAAGLIGSGWVWVLGLEFDFDFQLPNFKITQLPNSYRLPNCRCREEAKVPVTASTTPLSWRPSER